MTVSKKIKIINNKIEQSKAQYKLSRKAVKILALSSQNVNKYEFLTDKEVLLEKDILEKAAAIKRFKCLVLYTELKKQASIAEKQYCRLKMGYRFDEKYYLHRSSLQQQT